MNRTPNINLHLGRVLSLGTKGAILTSDYASPKRSDVRRSDEIGAIALVLRGSGTYKRKLAGGSSPSESPPLVLKALT